MILINIEIILCDGKGIPLSVRSLEFFKQFEHFLLLAAFHGKIDFPNLLAHIGSILQQNCILSPGLSSLFFIKPNSMND